MTGGGRGDTGWARGAAITGWVLTPIVAVLGGVAAIVHENDPSIALGAATTLIAGAGFPLIAAGGASSRNRPGVTGIPGLRIGAWVGYGAFIVAAGTMIGIGASGGDVPQASAVACAGLGAVTLFSITYDTMLTANQAARLAEAQPADSSVVHLSPFIAPVAKTSATAGRESSPSGGILGLFGRF
jgi:hypothetical protein